MDLALLLHRSRRSAFHRWLLNIAISRAIPFNRRRGLRVEPLPQGGFRVLVPYRRLNMNHIRGIHACCLATAAELCSGLALMELLDAGRFRIIMKSLTMEYRFQAKADAHAEFSPSRQEVESGLLRPLETGGPVLYTAVVPLHDVLGNHLATGHITWQLKPWDKVRTR